MFDDEIEFGARDRLEVGDTSELLPAAIGADRAELERHGEKLVNEDRPAPLLLRNPLDPTFSREFDEGHGLKNRLGILAKECRVCRGSGPAPRSPHPLHER